MKQVRVYGVLEDGGTASHRQYLKEEDSLFQNSSAHINFISPHAAAALNNRHTELSFL